MATVLMTLCRVLITLRITTHAPPSRNCVLSIGFLCNVTTPRKLDNGSSLSTFTVLNPEPLNSLFSLGFTF